MCLSMSSTKNPGEFSLQRKIKGNTRILFSFRCTCKILFTVSSKLIFKSMYSCVLISSCVLSSRSFDFPILLELWNVKLEYFSPWQRNDRSSECQPRLVYLPKRYLKRQLCFLLLQNLNYFLMIKLNLDLNHDKIHNYYEFLTANKDF